MRQAIPQILRSLDAGRPVAYCRLVETRGSTPQKAGAAMLVYEDGSQDGTLGGGCVEAEVKRRAIVILDSGQAELAEFQLDHDYGWDDGLICGGRMSVAIFPLVDDMHREYFHQLQLLLQQGAGFVEALVATEKTPRSYAFDDSQSYKTALTAETVEQQQVTASELKSKLPNMAARPRPSFADQVAYLPIMPRHRLIIVGAGHIGQAVAELAVSLDFDVWIVDDRTDCVTEDRFPNVHKRIVGAMSEVLPNLDVTSNSYCLIVTRGHNHDQEALFHLATRPARYIGLIGSRRKIRLIFDNLLAEGVPRESLERVFAPIGIDIGSQSVPEIAVSVAAELVAHRNLDGQVPGRPSSIPVAEE